MTPGVGTVPAMNTTINHWPLRDRPRERLLAQGSAALADAELLAVLLRTGIRGLDAVALARMLLAEFGSIGALLAATPERALKSRGLGRAKYCQLAAAAELARRAHYETLTRAGGLSSPDQAADYLKARLSHLPREVFAVMFLDTRHRVIAFEEMFFGTIDGASVHPREVVSRALALAAAAVIVAHNHPSGVAEPSAADRHLTRQLSQALALVDVRLLDHFIVGDGAPTSLAQLGML